MLDVRDCPLCTETYESLVDFTPAVGSMYVYGASEEEPKNRTLVPLRSLIFDEAMSADCAESLAGRLAADEPEVLHDRLDGGNTHLHKAIDHSKRLAMYLMTLGFE